MGLDIEWNCTSLSATQQCTKCGGWHTMPGRHLDSPDREFYESLWKREDETGNHHVTCAYRLDELEKYLKKCDEWNSTIIPRNLRRWMRKKLVRKRSRLFGNNAVLLLY